MTAPVLIRRSLDEPHRPVVWPERDGKRWFVLNLSGGRTSGYMLRRLLDSNGGRVPERTVIAFMNTGKELEETLWFVQEMQSRWQVPVVWPEYRRGRPGEGKRHAIRITDFENACREGEPFEDLMRAKKSTPNTLQRLCTSELKVETLRRYLLWHLGLKRKQYTSLLGIRYDEPKRLKHSVQNEHCLIDYPLANAGVMLHDVDRYWSRESDFDLGLGPDEGNCDLCYLKGERKLVRLMRKRPEAWRWWHWAETADFGGKVGVQPDKRFKFDVTFEELHARAEAGGRQGELFAAPGDEDEVSCFCGD